MVKDFSRLDSNLRYCCISYDLEPWYRIENLRGASISDSDDRLAHQLELVCEFLRSQNIVATFFILSDQAVMRQSGLLRKLRDLGHEIACHGTSHRLLTDRLFTKEAIVNEIGTSKSMLEDATGVSVRGFRAPCFSITDSLFDILAGLEFDYDSSLNNSPLNSRYGTLSRSGNLLRPFVDTDTSIVEIPLSVMNFFSRFNLPISGGGFGRVIPRSLLLRAILMFLEENVSWHTYFHPWEFDDGLPRIKQGFFKDFATYYNLASYTQKLHSIINHVSGHYRLKFLTYSQLACMCSKNEIS